jgi:hypothetical protein
MIGQFLLIIFNPKTLIQSRTCKLIQIKNALIIYVFFLTLINLITLTFEKLFLYY